MKVCAKCKTKKDIKEFYKDPKSKTGAARSKCIKCFLELKNTHNHIPEVRAAINTTNTVYRNLPENKVAALAHRQIPKIKKANLLYNKLRYQKPKVKEHINKTKKEKYATDPAFRIKQKTSVLIRKVFKSIGLKKNIRTLEFMGCSKEQLINHQNLFLGKPCEECHTTIITFTNSHLDHLLPMDILNSLSPNTTYKQLLLVAQELNQLWNLRLICETCNLKKHDKLVWSNRTIVRVLGKENKNE